MEYNSVDIFENTVAEFFGSKYAVATDCCTHAIELALRYTHANDLTCPTKTYISVPFTLTKLGLRWQWQDLAWVGYYTLGNSNVIDAATWWKKDSYVPGTFMCLSFQFKKHLNLIRGGAILLDDDLAYKHLQVMAHDGRQREKDWKTQDISVIGYHYYMPIETARLGLEKFSSAAETPAKIWSHLDYPHLPDMQVFK